MSEAPTRVGQASHGQNSRGAPTLAGRPARRGRNSTLVRPAPFRYQLLMRNLIAVAATVVALAGSGWPQTPPAATITPAPDSAFAERFRQADRNGDGVITDDEARAAGLWFTNDFDSVDTDRSGTVTLFELVRAGQQRLSRWLSARDSADTNHDGQLTEAEAAQVPGLASTFTAADRNHDRAVSRAEFESYALDRLNRGADLPSVAPNIFEKRF